MKHIAKGIIGNKQRFAIEYDMGYENPKSSLVFECTRLWFGKNYVGNIKNPVFFAKLYKLKKHLEIVSASPITIEKRFFQRPTQIYNILRKKGLKDKQYFKHNLMISDNYDKYLFYTLLVESEYHFFWKCVDFQDNTKHFIYHFSEKKEYVDSIVSSWINLSELIYNNIRLYNLTV